MARVIILDTGPLGMVTHPKAEETNRKAVEWLTRRLEGGATVLVPEISDYELRRELLRSEKQKGIRRLDELGRELGYLAITTEVMRMAARFWADARTIGLPTAADAALDADVILAAQARSVMADGRDAVIATTNPKHLERYSDARLWEDVP